jgi:TolB-like protein/DNA-binding winged helix-turn-helix (wHTH) protein
MDGQYAEGQAKLILIDFERLRQRWPMLEFAKTPFSNMMPGTDLPRSVRFANFELDARAGELWAEDQKVHLQEQPLQILVMLIARAGDVVTREELHKALWPGSTFGDLEDSLNHAIRRLREALGDTAERPRFIETVPRRGYRFIAPVEPLAPAPSPKGREQESVLPSPTGSGYAAGLGEGAVAPVALSVTGEGEESPRRPPVPQTRERPQGAPLRKRWIAPLTAGALAALLAIVFGLNVFGLRERLLKVVGAVREPPPRIQSLAVLPLENLSRDPEQEYFADGMTEALITDLGKVSALRVISRTSVMQYKGTKKPLPEVARELNVDGVLEGTVARSGNQVRITANLLHAPTDRHLWAETYEGDLGDVLVLQDEVARAIAEQIRIKLTPQEKARFAQARPVNPEAHEAYLKGRYYLNLRTESGAKKSLDYFQQAIQKDPGYARAYAGLAGSYAVSVKWGSAPPREAFPRMKAAALKALGIDGMLAEPHALVGVAKVDFDFDFVGAEKEYKLAIKLNPSYATAHEWYAEYLALMGRHNEAFPEIKRAQELDPLSPIMSAVGAAYSLYARRYDEAIAESRRTLELYPGFYPAHLYLGRAYEQKKLYDQAIAEYQKAMALEPGSWRVAEALECVYAATGRRTEALRTISNLRVLSKRKYVSSLIFARIYAGLGDADQTCVWLGKVYEERSYGLSSMKVAPLYDPLRSYPCFQFLLGRMNFPP